MICINGYYIYSGPKVFNKMSISAIPIIPDDMTVGLVLSKLLIYILISVTSCNVMYIYTHCYVV